MARYENNLEWRSDTSLFYPDIAAKFMGWLSNHIKLDIGAQTLPERSGKTQSEYDAHLASYQHARSHWENSFLAVGPNGNIWRYQPDLGFYKDLGAMADTDNPDISIQFDLFMMASWVLELEIKEGKVTDEKKRPVVKTEVIRKGVEKYMKTLTLSFGRVANTTQPFRFSGGTIIDGIPNELAFAFRNGLVDASAALDGVGEALHPFSPDIWLPCTLEADYTPEAFDAADAGELKAEQMLRMAFQDGNDVAADETMVVLRQAMGSALALGKSLDQAIMLIGPPRCGKSTFIDLLNATAGGFGTTLKLASFGSGGSGGRDIGFEAAKLECALHSVVTDAEINFGSGRESQARMTSLKGVLGHDSDKVQLAHEKHAKQIKPRSIFIGAGNPSLAGYQMGRDESGGMIARVTVLPLQRGFAGELDDTRMKVAALDESQRSILACWALRGAVDLVAQNGKLTVTEATRQSRVEMLAASASVMEWIKDRVVVTGDPKDEVPYSYFTLSLADWAKYHTNPGIDLGKVAEDLDPAWKHVVTDARRSGREDEVSGSKTRVKIRMVKLDDKGKPVLKRGGHYDTYRKNMYVVSGVKLVGADRITLDAIRQFLRAGKAISGLSQVPSTVSAMTSVEVPLDMMDELLNDEDEAETNVHLIHPID